MSVQPGRQYESAPVERLSVLGALIADPTRCSLLVALMDGRAWTAGELARHAGIAPSTASEHLSRLLDARFVAVENQGRHRYFRLQDPEIAELLESLGNLNLPSAPPTPRRSSAAQELHAARSCYDHLAGHLGVLIFDRMLTDGHLEQHHTTLTLTASGDALFEQLGAHIHTIRHAHNPTAPLARTCLDWTERRHHLAGTAGAALFQALLNRRWLTRGNRPRSVLITKAGHTGLTELGWY